MFYGRGAGGAPTASAVLGDLVTAARNRVTGSTGRGSPRTPSCRSCRWGRPRRLLRAPAGADRPGVLAAVAGVFAEHGVSIRSMTQKGEGDEAELLILTHPGREADLAATVAQLRDLDSVDEVVGFMRVIGAAQ